MSKKKMYGASLNGMRAALCDGLVELGRNNERIVVIDCETGTATNILEFRDAFPDRYVTTGVAEQNGISFAFGVSRSGLIPVVPLFSAFITRRALDQIFIQVGYASANIKMIGCYSGLTTPNTGATHQSINDVAIIRSIPGITVIETADEFEFRQALSAVMEIEGPVYLRMIRGDISPYDQRVIPEDHQFQIGKASVLREGKDISLIGNGMMVLRCMEAAEELEKKGFAAEVINCSSIKPLDRETIVKSVKKTGAVVTAENHSVIGGTGSAVAELLSEENPVFLGRVGIMDRYGESAELKDLFEEYGLDAQTIINSAEDIIGRKKR